MFAGPGLDTKLEPVFGQLMFEYKRASCNFIEARLLKKYFYYSLDGIIQHSYSP